MAEIDVKAFNRKRGNVKYQINRLLSRDVDSANEAHWRAILESCGKCRQRLEEVKEESYKIADELIYEENATILQSLEDDLSDFEVRVNSILNEFKQKENSSSKEVNDSYENLNFQNISVRLPEIPLPKFSGDFQDWYMFRSQFETIIESNKLLNENQKLYYLQSSLIGPAKQIQTQDDTYESLMNALVQRYENKRLIVNSHLKALLNQDKVKGESAKDLRALIDNILKNLRALKQLKLESNDLSNLMLMNIILQKLDPELRKSFEMSLVDTEIPKWDTFIQFLEQRCNILENLHSNSLPHSKTFQFKPKTFLNQSATSHKICKICGLNHLIQNCKKFKEMTVSERYNTVKKYNLCLNCLAFSHLVKNCTSSKNCRMCNRRHSSYLCRTQQKESITDLQKESENKSGVKAISSNPSALNINSPCFQPNSTSIINPEQNQGLNNYSNEFIGSSLHSQQNSNVLLSTVMVYSRCQSGNLIELRSVLDSGSQSNLITQEAVNALGLKGKKINVLISGINGTSLIVKSKVSAVILSKDGQFKKLMDFLVVPKISSFTPTNKLDLQDVNIPGNITLSDENFHIPAKINVLIGNEFFFDILKNTTIKLADGKLILQDTVFGFTVSGVMKNDPRSKNYFCGLTTDLNELNESIKRFWEIEEIYDFELSSKSSEELLCEKHFVSTHKRDKFGRYIVQMPLSKDPECLGDSKQTAITRLNSSWKRFLKNPQLLEMYKNFMEEYITMGHMEEVVEEIEPKNAYYLPHHGVLRTDNKTTPLRVVFNASSETSTGESLNSIQMNGGVVQEDLFSILLRFRTHKYGITADIKKMFRMILIDESQRDLLRIVWKNSIDVPLKIYRLSTVTYGTSSAPFLATRTLRQLVIDDGQRYPVAADVLDSDTYMDDVLTGTDDLETGTELQRQLVSLLQCAGMELHKWASNSPLLLPDSGNFDKDLSLSSVETKTLGLLWKPLSDSFSFKVSFDITSSDNSVISKRTVLSCIARIFDPLGLLGPVVAKGKIFLQKLWSLNLEWDDALPSKELKEWLKLKETFKLINEVNVERYILTTNATVIELHGFADASEAAYGAVIYCKSQTSSGEIAVKLVTSKSRVSPVKKLSIPRLELCATVLLAKLMKRVLSSLRINVSDTFYWSDSMIALAWLRKEPHLLKTFVANRVTMVQSLTSVQQWRYVPSSENPADLISRGLDLDKLLQSELWWCGPKFLTENNYPTKKIQENVILDDFSIEMKKSSTIGLTLNVDSFINDFISISNNYTKLLRVLSYIYRFFHNCRKRGMSGPLTTLELNEAETTLVKLVQNQEFKRDIIELRKTGKVTLNSKLKNLLPFIDDKGVLRVGGRISNSMLNFNRKFPIILPKDNKLTALIAEMYHKRYLHVGPQTLLFLIRQRFWPIGGRNICRKIVHECIVCFKAKPITCQEVMGQLPPERVTPNFPFNCVGVDFCGPFFIKYPNQRKGQLNKVYIAIFVCFVTKACHLELVMNLTTDAFIATLKRFFSRRGKCAQLYSDNAKTFIGSNSELKRLNKLVSNPDEGLANFLTTEAVQWNFIPPRAPNHGGLWEACVKSVKYHLKRVVGITKLTYEEFLTVIIQVEAILNSRPLYPLSADLNDFEILTPGHFLIGRSITSITEPSVISIADHRLKSWQKMTKFVQIIWKQWSNNYLSTLQQLNKWHFSKNNVRVGDMVILKDSNLAPLNWPLGRITEVFPGKDQRIRVVNVKTKTGIFKRPISKICILPLPQSD